MPKVSASVEVQESLIRRLDTTDASMAKAEDISDIECLQDRSAATVDPC